jgi:hypothetical protein
LICHITLAEANGLYEEGEVELCSKGNGKHLRVTAAKANQRRNLQWRPLDSGGYTVMQLADV